MLLALYALIVLSGLIEAAMGISIIVARENHFLLQGAPAQALRALGSGSNFLCVFIGLALLAVAGMHLELLRCLRRGREETHTLLRGYGALMAVGGVLLFLAFKGTAGGHAWAYLLIDAVRGLLLAGTSFVAANAASTVRQLRLPKRGRTSDRARRLLGLGGEKPASEAAARPMHGGRHERGSRDRDRGRGGDRRRSGGRREAPRGGSSARPLGATGRVSSPAARVSGPAARPAIVPAARPAIVPAARPAIVPAPRPSESSADAGTMENGARTGRRRGRRGGRGRTRRTSGAEGERSGIGRAIEEQREAPVRRGSSFEDAEARERFEAFERGDAADRVEASTSELEPGEVREPRPRREPRSGDRTRTRPAGGARLPARDAEEAGPAATIIGPVDADPVEEGLELPATIEYGGRRRRKGRTSSGAMFRPREKSHTTTGGRFDAEPRKEWGSGDAEPGGQE